MTCVLWKRQTPASVRKFRLPRYRRHQYRRQTYCLNWFFDYKLYNTLRTEPMCGIYAVQLWTLRKQCQQTRVLDCGFAEPIFANKGPGKNTRVKKCPCRRCGNLRCHNEIGMVKDFESRALFTHSLAVCFGKIWKSNRHYNTSAGGPLSLEIVILLSFPRRGYRDNRITRTSIQILP